MCRAHFSKTLLHQDRSEYSLYSNDIYNSSFSNTVFFLTNVLRNVIVQKEATEYSLTVFLQLAVKQEVIVTSQALMDESCSSTILVLVKLSK